jgi:acyl dehydratase
MTHQAVAHSQQNADVWPWTVAQADLVRYAGAARDFNAIHYDTAAAREFGFIRPVAHGMLTLGRLLTRLADRLGPDAIRSSTTRFTGPAYVDSHLVLTTAPVADDRLKATVTDEEGATVLSTTVVLGPADRHADSPEGELVADRRLRVEQGPVTRFAEALGARSEVFLRQDVAREAGYRSIPAVPTYGFALPGWGFFPELSGNERATAPDAVRDCQDWARTSGPVVHAGQRFVHSRPLLVGETVRARTSVVGRATKQGGSRTLRFTDVATVLTDADGAHVLTSAMTLVVAD